MKFRYIAVEGVIGVGKTTLVEALAERLDATQVLEEWEENPFIRVWRGLDPEGEEQCMVRGEPATLVLWAPDYDGTNKAWVRYPDGRDAIVGGSQVERG